MTDGSVVGWICSPRIYRFCGWLFEYPAYAPPWPLKKDGKPRERAGRVFWKVCKKFDLLTDAEKETYREGGGCVPFVARNTSGLGAGGRDAQ